MKSWGLMKKLFTHNLDLNVEMNIYIFGFDDMKIVHYTSDGEIEYRITPHNVFTRHHGHVVSFQFFLYFAYQVHSLIHLGVISLVDTLTGVQ